MITFLYQKRFVPQLKSMIVEFKGRLNEARLIPAGLLVNRK